MFILIFYRIIGKDAHDGEEEDTEEKETSKKEQERLDQVVLIFYELFVSIKYKT